MLFIAKIGESVKPLEVFLGIFQISKKLCIIKVMWNPINKIKTTFYNLGFFARTLKGVVYFIRNSQASFRILIMQILFTFVHAMGISTLLALAIGAAVKIIGMPMLAGISQDQLIYSLLIIIITR